MLRFGPCSDHCKSTQIRNEADAVNMAVMQRREREAVQNQTDLDTDTDVVVSN